MAVDAFTNGLKDKDLVKSLYLNPPEDFDDIMDKAKDHMKVDEVMQSIDDEALQSTCNKKTKKEKGEQKKPERQKSVPPSKKTPS